MSTAPQKPPRYRFGPFELDPSACRLSRNGMRVKLQDLPYRLLLMLVEKPGEIVTREEVRQRLWPENTFVEFDNSLGVAIRKVRDSLDDDAEAPRYVETIPRRGYRFLAPVTVESGVVGETAPSLVAEPSPVTVAANASPHHRYWVMAGLIFLLVTAALYELRSLPRHSSAATQSNDLTRPLHVRRSVAVLGFRNLPGRPEDNWLSAAFSEMLNTELAAGGELRLVSGEDVARAKSELPITDEDTLAKSTLKRLHTDPGADIVVMGSYTPLSGQGGKSIRLDIRMQDTVAGETIAEDSVTGSEEDLFEMVSQASVHLRQRLGVSIVTPADTAAVRASLPSSDQAVRLYAEGRARAWAFDFGRARDLLRKAIAADPDYPLAHSALSDVWWHTGYEGRARVEARRALELSNHLSREQRLLVEGQYQRTVEDWPKAVDTYHSLFQLFPDNLDYGLLFASAQMHLKPADSLQTLADLRRLPSPLGDDARIDMTEASAWINRDFTKARAAAKLAIEKATAQGSPVIVSRTYGILCQQEPAIDASTEAIDICRNALEASIAAKDPNGEAMMRTDLAAVYYLRGDLTQSAEMLQQAVKKFRQVGNRDGVATALSNFADARLSQGDLMEAKKLLEQSIPEYQAVDDKEGIVLNLNSLADIWRQQGELDRAETTYRQAEDIARKIEDNNAIAYVLSGMGDLALDRGDLTLAGKRYEEALALRNQAGEKQSAAESRVSLAKLAIEEGHASEAEVSVRACKQQFQEEQQADDELNASTVLINALLAEGKPGEAKKEVAASQQLGNESQNRFLHLQFELASGRVLLASGYPEASQTLFLQVARDATRHGFAGLAFADQLALAELARTTQHTTVAQMQLRALHTAARSKGFGLIARKALEETLALRNQIGRT